MDKTALEAICERKGDADTKQIITTLFKKRIYVPLLRVEENVSVGEPSLNKDPRTAANAGPMSPEQAQSLSVFLRSPARNSEISHIRLSDPLKGVERIARRKCSEMGINWSEWWPFLDAAIDLRSQQGLELLENHFRKVVSV